MKAGRILTVVAVALFTLGLATAGFTAEMGGEVKGTVTKIEGSNVTIKDAMGTEKTIAAKNADAMKDLKVGDQVTAKDGTITKEGGTGSYAPPSTPKY